MENNQQRNYGDRHYSDPAYRNRREDGNRYGWDDGRENESRRGRQHPGSESGAGRGDSAPERISGYGNSSRYGEKELRRSQREDETLSTPRSGRIYTDDGYYNSSYEERSGSIGDTGRFISRSWRLDGPYRGKGPKGYRRSDERIVEDASDALQHCGAVDASSVEIDCKDGLLTLKGKVKNRDMKRAAEDCVEDVQGVNDVMNSLSVEKGLLDDVRDWFSSNDNEKSSNSKNY